ncbi:hypothetical protein K3495_g1447 [Podosphaera aphanis]|nr:hypothetical protein K3495_g1447 [Podosphaera aphanis]
MSVRVVARIRPLLPHELDKDTIVRAESSQEGKPCNVVRIPNPKKESEEFSFRFNAVYDLKSTQEELFTNEIAPHLKSLFQGLDVTIFAYGVTGTGKTHTMRGGLKLTERGVIPRLLSGVFRRARKASKDSGGKCTVAVSLAYYEIYNDKVYDLFQAPDKRSLSGLPLREKDGKTIVVGLSEHECNNLKDFERLYIEANNNRSTAGTKLNAQSSRSHAILQVKITQVTGEEILVSTASAIDLAGSEDNRRTENNRERMVESASINKSLFVLSSCIDAIGRGDKRIPYRESRMTRILSLGQNKGITIMILNLAPLRSYHLDTLSSLNISSRAKRIEVREIENEIVFTQPPRKIAQPNASSMLRQPLRPLANAHNTHPSGGAQKGDRPAKSFSVYTDKTKGGPRSSTANAHTTLKRSSDQTLQTRPVKMARSNPANVKASSEISAAKIEQIVERKVQEALASRALEKSATILASNEISDAVQRRLEALERKIESGEAEESRADGLRFLLMAKQHKERGEDSSALKMYQLAVPFFPEQERLTRKIENLKAKIQAKRVDKSAKPPVPKEEDPSGDLDLDPLSHVPTSCNPAATSKENLEWTHRAAYYEGEDDPKRSPNPDEDDKDASYSPRIKTKKPKIKPAATLSNNSLSTPRTRHLLDIINSRDMTMIMGLHGVGAKKARDLVEFLELQDEDEGGNIQSVQELIAVPGLGKRSVEKAYEGITALLQ